MVPDTGGFRAKLLAQIKTAMTGVSAELPLAASTVKLDAAIAAAQAKIATLNKALSGLSLDADAKALIAKISGLDAQALNLSKRLASMEIAAGGASEIAAELAELQVRGAKLADTIAKMPASIDPTNAILELDIVKEQIKGLIDELADIPTDIDIRAVADKIISIEAQVLVLRDQLTGLKMDADTTAMLSKLAEVETELAGLQAARDLILNADNTPALAKIATLKTGLTDLQHAIASIPIDVNDVAGLAKLAGFAAKVDALTQKVNNFTIDANVGPAVTQLILLQAQVSAFGKSVADAAKPTDQWLTQLSTTVGIAGIGWANLSAKTKLFAGALTQLGIPASIAMVSGLHILIDAFAEAAAVIIPAGIALGTFGVAAVPTIQDITKQMQNVLSVSKALNQNIYPLTGGFAAMADAVKPQVYTLFGEAIQIAQADTGNLTKIAVGAGKALDDLGARATAALTSGGFGTFLKNGPADLAQIGDVIGNIIGTIGNLLKRMPDYAQTMLAALDSLTRGLESVTSSSLVQWLSGAGLAVHGFLLWAGLAATGAVILGNALLGLGAKFGLVAAGTTVFDAVQFGAGLRLAASGAALLGAEMITLGAGEDIAAASALTLEGVWAAITAVNPLIWIAAAIGGLVALVLAFGNAGNAASRYSDNVNAALQKVPVSQLSVSLMTQITNTTNLANQAQTQLNNTVKIGTVGYGVHDRVLTGVTAAYQQQSAVVQGYQGELSTLKTYQSNYNSLLKTAGGNLSILNDAGITSTDIMTTNKGALQRLTIEVQAQVDAQKAMGLGVGQAAAALNAENFQASDAQTSLKKLVSAENGLLDVVTGGQVTFNNFQQSIQGTTAKFVSPSGLANAAALAKGNLTGLNEQSLAFSNTLYTQSIPSAQKMIGALQQQGISQTDLTAVVATTAGQMTKYTGSNTEANSVIVALINNALGPNTVSLQTLKGWIDKNSTSMDGFSSIVAQSTVKAGTLAGVLQNDLVKSFQDSLFNASGAQTAINNMTNAIINQGSQSTAFKSARDQLIADLVKTGLSATDAKNYVDNLQNQINSLHGTSANIAVTATGSGGVSVSAPGLPAGIIALHQITGAAAGGLIQGGVPGKDSVLGMLMPGEVVVPTSMVKAGAVDHLRGKLPGFAAGGLVNLVPNTSTAVESDTASILGTDTAAVMKQMYAQVVAAQVKAAQAAAAQFVSSGGAGSGIIQSMFVTLAAQRGWTGAQLNALLSVEQAEAGFCLTINHMILTRRGWLKHDEVVVGDETIGYNPETRKSEWTRVTCVLHFGNKPVVTYGNKYWQSTFTPGHRWLTETRQSAATYRTLAVCPVCGFTGKNPKLGIRNHLVRSHGWDKAQSRNEETWQEPKLTPWNEFTGRERVILSRPADTGPGLPITDREAALLGWIAGDGCVMENRPVQRKAPPAPPANWQERTEAAPFGLRRDGTPKKSPGGRPYKDLDRTSVPTTSGLTVTIAQSKIEHFAAIEDALTEIADVGRYAQDNRGRSSGKGFGIATLVGHSWRLPAAYAYDLLARAGNPKTDAVEQVLRMSASQRHAWLEAMIAAEGHVHIPEPGKPKDGPKTVIYQKEGVIAEAIELAVYLEGYRPGRNVTAAGEVCIRPTVPHVGGPQRLSFTEDAGTADVWCVTTELGSWTTCNESGVFLTGNSLTATNPSSGAYGLAQFINGPSEYAQYGGNSTTAVGQITAMLNYIEQRYGNPAAAWAHECVTLDTRIITRRGWLYYNELRDGDETIGFNPATGHSEWTLIERVHVYDDAPLVRLSNKTWEAVCTPQHRWVARHRTRTRLTEPYRTEEVMTETARLTSRHAVRVAAETDTGAGPAISDREAELLGWVLGDGSVAHIKSKKGSNPEHWRTGTGSLVSIRFYQSKPEHVKKFDTLVDGLLFNRMTRTMKTPKGRPGLPLVTWEFTHAYSAELLKRSGYDHKDPVSFVLSLSPEQREAFLRGVFGAEGSYAGNGEGFSSQGYHNYPRTKTYFQNDGLQQDAIILAVYLSGKRPGISEKDNRGQKISRWTVSTVGAIIRETKPFLGGESIRREDAGRGPAWCPTTSLGSWTMRQGRQVTLTGNSQYHWYKQGGLVPGYASGGLIGNLAAGQGSEQRTYGALTGALSAALAHPTGYFASHKASLTGEQGTLTKRQAAELGSYTALAGKGLTSANLGKFGTALKAVGTVNADKYLSTAEPGATSSLASALRALEAVAAAGKTSVAKAAAATAATTSAAKNATEVKSAAAIATAARAAAAHANAATKEGSAATSILSESQYQDDLSAVHGISLTDIRKSPHLTHLWHLLHLQHLADLGLAGGGMIGGAAMVPRLVHDAGGWIPPGVSMSVNRTGQPEQVIPPGSSRKLSPDAQAIVAALRENTAAVQRQGTAFAQSLNSTANASAARGSYSNRR